MPAFHTRSLDPATEILDQLGRPMPISAGEPIRLLFSSTDARCTDVWGVPVTNPFRMQATITIFQILAFTTSLAAAEPAAGLSVGVVHELVGQAPPTVLRALGRPFRDLLAAQGGLAGELAPVADATSLADRLKSGEYQLGVFPGYEFARVWDLDSALVPLVVTVPPSGRPRAVVVVRQDAKAREPADLKAGGVAIPTGTRSHVRIFLSKLGTGLAGPATAAPQSAADALEAVLEGKSQAAAMDEAALTGYGILQPGAAQRLRVLARSDPFPQNVIAYRKGGLSEGEATRVRAALVGAEKAAAGKPLLFLWNIKGFAAPPADYPEHLTASLKAYPSPLKR